MDLIALFSLMYGGLLLVYIAWLTLPTASRCLLSRLRSSLTSLHNGRVPRTSVTLLEAGVLVVYLAANVAIFARWVRSIEVLSETAAMMSAINAVPLFLGGRTNPLADFIGVPLSTYYLAHRWIGVVVVVEGLLHASIALSLPKPKDSQVTASGYLIFASLTAIGLTSVWFARRFLRAIYGQMHFALSLAAISGLIWHTARSDVAVLKIPALVAGGLWLSTTLFRLIRLSFFGVRADIVRALGYQEALRLHVRSSPVSIKPGAYFYILTRGSFFQYSLFRSYPVTVVSHEQRDGGATDLTFLILRQPGQSRSFWLNQGEHILLDGPYGRDLQLNSFSVVIMAAKGIGIAGVLPLALNLAERRHQDRRSKLSRAQEMASFRAGAQDATRAETAYGPDLERLFPLFRDGITKVNLYWVLEDKTQYDWVSSELPKLQALDPGNHLLVVWCIFPAKATEAERPFKENRYFRCIYPSEEDHHPDFGESKISEQIQDECGSSSRSIIAACGDPEFVTRVRREAIAHTSRHSQIHFVEVDYRPRRNGKPREWRAWKGEENVGLSERDSGSRSEEQNISAKAGIED